MGKKQRIEILQAELARLEIKRQDLISQIAYLENGNTPTDQRMNRQEIQALIDRASRNDQIIGLRLTTRARLYMTMQIQVSPCYQECLKDASEVTRLLGMKSITNLVNRERNG